LQQPLRFFELLTRLDYDTAAKTAALELELQVGRSKIATKCGDAVVNPGVVALIVNPEMLMSVNVHCHVRAPRNSCEI